MRYPEAVNLPFNRTILDRGFVPARPGDVGPEGGGRWVLLQGNAMVMRFDGKTLALHDGEFPAWAESKGDSLFLGDWEERPLWGAVIGTGSGLPEGYVAEPFNANEERIPGDIMSLGGLAHQILQWQRHCTVCSRCGGTLEAIPGTWGRCCQSCRHHHFPHIHPCVIVLVRRRDEFLLVRKPEWPAGRYSLVAGFVDFGESLEECVRREVREETGIEVANVHYVGSQNWPFPSQLMAGFVADCAGGELRVDRDELEDARWFCSAGMPESLPGKRSIARWIIDRYMLGEKA
ncbi:MAG: NAD(+) diphosphatase [Geobacter sp.]|nr:NAD(+) diphosphatase [Geobacter sp.]